MRKRSLLALLAIATFAAAVAAGLGSSVAFAGEVTGNCNNAKEGSKAADNCKEDQNANANSICSFSGQNDNPTSIDLENPPGRVQSYGYSAVAQKWTEEGPPHAAGQGNGGVPGQACRGGSN